MENFMLRLREAVSEVYKLNGKDLENYYLLKTDFSEWSENERENLILLINS